MRRFGMMSSHIIGMYDSTTFANVFNMYICKLSLLVILVVLGFYTNPDKAGILDVQKITAGNVSL